MTNNNLYDFKTPKSGNEETGFFNIKGRITRKTFFLRLFLVFAIYVFSSFLNSAQIISYFSLRLHLFIETIHLYILPLLLLVFVFIQGAKRVHDVNKTGWFFFVPFYNIFLSVLPGNKGPNSYGLDPAPVKNVQFFDELDKETINSDELIVSGLDKWRLHLMQVRKQNSTKTYQECLVIAKKTFKSEELNISGLDKWRLHLLQVRKQNSTKTYQECIDIAKKSFKSTKKKVEIYFFIIILLVLIFFIMDKK